jgi:hypothetical protein
MALDGNTTRALNIGLAQYGVGAVVAAAIDANTLKTSMTTISELTTTTADATTTWLHTAIKTLVSDMQTGGHMA